MDEWQYEAVVRSGHVGGGTVLAGVSLVIAGGLNCNYKWGGYRVT